MNASKFPLAALAIAALTCLASASAIADDDKKGNKHRLYAHGPAVHAPVYHAGHARHYQRPHYAHQNHGYRHHRQGYWRDGRWIAPVVVGATIGAFALSASAPGYAAPAPVYYDAPVNYYTPGDQFSWADVNNDGYLSYHEARRHGNLHRNFGRVDWNGDGYLSREEVNGWRHHW